MKSLLLAFCIALFAVSVAYAFHPIGGHHYGHYGHHGYGMYHHHGDNRWWSMRGDDNECYMEWRHHRKYWVCD